ncbi:MAG: hypothetical protein ACRC1K_12735 [Planctomycetia bacterium]
MANELQVISQLTFQKGNFTTVSRGSTSVLNRNVAGTKYHQTVQSVGTTEEALSTGDVTAGGYVYLKNLDSTNFINVRAEAAGAAFSKLKAGDVAQFPTAAAATIRVIADTAACDLEILIVSE